MWRRSTLTSAPEARNDQYLNVFFYDIYPYLCGTVFLVGSWLRYDYGQYTARLIQPDAG